MNSGLRDSRLFHNFSEPDAGVLMRNHGFDHPDDSLGGTHRIVPLKRVKWSIYGTWFYILNYFCPEPNQKSSAKLVPINAADPCKP